MMKNFILRINKEMFQEIKKISEVYNKTQGELIGEKFLNIIKNKKNDVFYKFGLLYGSNLNMKVAIKMSEDLIQEIKKNSKIYKKSASEMVREIISSIIEDKKNDIFYKLANFEETSEEETIEILETLKKEDLEIVDTERVEL
jgi:predicted DNA-binding protein